MSVVSGPSNAGLVARVQNMIMKPALEWDVIAPEPASVDFTLRAPKNANLRVENQNGRVEVKNRQFLVNGRAILIKGVNLHDHDDVTGFERDGFAYDAD